MRPSRLATVVTVCASFGYACSGGSGEGSGVSVFSPDSGGTDATAAPTFDGSGPAFDPDGQVGFTNLDDAGSTDATVTTVDKPDVNGPLVVSPPSQTIDLAYGQVGAPLTLAATINGYAVPAAFAIDRGEIGSLVSATGVLTPSGLAGGTATVTVTYGGQTVKTMVTVRIHLGQNGAPAAGDAGAGEAGSGDAGDAEAGTDASATSAGGNGGVGGEGIGGAVSQATQTLLAGGQDAGAPDAGGASDAGDAGAGPSWLYPFDQTVWPEGLLAPLLQWSAPQNYDAVMIHLSENGFDYQGFFAATATPFVHHPIPQAAWDLLVNSNQGEDVHVTVTFSSGGALFGPLTQTWHVAHATLAGTVYYNSYGTNLAHNYTSNGVTFGGATLAIKHGATSPVLVAGNDQECRVCHAVSANGARLITQQEANSVSSTYDLLNGYAETTMAPGDSRFAWAGISPDGAYLITDGARGSGNPYLQGAGWNQDTQLFALPGGAALPSTGIPAGLRAGSPVFSPDGTHVAFNFYGGNVPTAGSGGDAGADGGSDGGVPLVADGVSLAAMDFDPATKAFSNFRVLFTPPSGTAVWPSFLPTNDAVVFELETQNNGRDWGGTRSRCDSTACMNDTATGAKGELWWVSLASPSQAARLDGLNGKGYLPTLAATDHTRDELLNYEPTVNPVPRGGYAWVVFTSRRLYGNVATLKPYWSDPRYVDLHANPTPKKLWVAAVDLNAPPGTDPSHPAFYLPAQEILAGNSRGYWVVDPCVSNGTSCQTGDQCCGGYCENQTCTAQPPVCSSLDDKCTGDGDCCGMTQGVQCINGRCAEPAPPPPPPPPVVGVIN